MIRIIFTNIPNWRNLFQNPKKGLLFTVVAMGVVYIFKELYFYQAYKNPDIFYVQENVEIMMMYQQWESYMDLAILILLFPLAIYLSMVVLENMEKSEEDK